MATYQTEQKKELIGFLERNSHRALSIDQICEEMANDGSCACPPSRSTVYRLIPKLLSENVIKQLAPGSSMKPLYQIIGGADCNHHGHLKCTRCGRIIHMSPKVTKELSQLLSDKEGFVMATRETVLYGICRDCIKECRV